MSRLLLSLLAVLAIFSVTVSSGKICPKNEVWDSCGTACPLSCDQPTPRPCTLQCVIGCRCEDGLLRNNLGKCVPLHKC